MKIVIIGATGQLGAELTKAMRDCDVVGLGHGDLDICDFIYTREVLVRHSPDVVINTAAYNKVDACENEISKAFWVNAFAVRNIAKVCEEIKSICVHISTNYVFDGAKRVPYTEDDLPNPLSVYGVSKLAGEHFVRNICQRHFVIRTAGLYGTAGARVRDGNFVETMIRLANEGRPVRVVNDQVLTPTYAVDLAKAIRNLVETDAYGLYHVTNSGECSWFEFARAIFELLGLEVNLTPITTAEYGANAARPQYAVMAARNLTQVGFEVLQPWKDALRMYLQERAEIPQRRSGGQIEDAQHPIG